MSSFISWVKKYPMTMLLIICCLIGGPYLGGRPRRMDTESDETADADESGCSGN